LHLLELKYVSYNSLHSQQYIHHAPGQEINPQIGPLKVCQRPLSHGHPAPISQLLRICLDAASCAFDGGVFVLNLPWRQLRISMC
jgi:hypothetical protein